MVVGNGVIPDFGDPGADLIHKKAVVGDQDDRAGIGAEVLFKPVARLDIQMVGRFVQ